MNSLCPFLVILNEMLGSLLSVRVTVLSDYIKHIFIRVQKTNEGLTGLKRHEDE